MPATGTSHISVEHVTFAVPDGTEIISDVSCVFARKRIGLVGDNGVGKTTLLKLLLGRLKPTKGRITVDGTLGYLPQDLQVPGNATVADVLNVREKIEALDRLDRGDADPAGTLQGIVGDDWNLRDQVERLLRSFGLDLPLDRPGLALSGGELVRLHLVGLIVNRYNFLVLDEPTNNLDVESRQALYRFIETANVGVVAVSHDRALLGRMDEIVEMFRDELRVYGGNYAFYREQRHVHAEALERLIVTKAGEVEAAHETARKATERNAKRARVGKKHAVKANLPAIVMGAMKNAAEAHAGKSRLVHERVLGEREDELRALRERRRPDNAIKLELPKTKVPADKVVFALKGVSFRYPGGPELFPALSYTMMGPERLVLRGRNGSGKTTLARIIRGELAPASGTASVGVKSVGYLDQLTRSLPENRSVLEIVREVAPEIPEGHVRIYLARLKFHRDAVHKRVEVLSGGERIRLALAREFLKTDPPRLLILDEPTNNLDLNSIERLESALSCYEGALVAISHDESFLRAIGIMSEITLG
ncbi:MAG: ABC-F family ATP-binding cassette domain-containing protein [Candidatus Coatesbacteria bacterium]